MIPAMVPAFHVFQNTGLNACYTCGKMSPWPVSQFKGIYIARLQQNHRGLPLCNHFEITVKNQLAYASYV